MTHDDVERWLDRYIEAWRSYDRERIGDLFAEDAECRYYPYEEPKRGRTEIVDSWLEDEDGPDSWEAEYRPFAVEGEAAVATGRSYYRDEPGGDIKRVYHNCFVLRFDADGRCSEFTEWFLLQPDA